MFPSARCFRITFVVICVKDCVPSLDGGAATSGSRPNEDLAELLRKLEEQGAEASTLRQQVLDLERLVILKDNECAELSIQNQVLLEELEQLRNDYKLVSEFYDEAVQESGAAKRNLKITQNEKSIS